LAQDGALNIKKSMPLANPKASSGNARATSNEKPNVAQATYFFE
jgi:hypothetical protein